MNETFCVSVTRKTQIVIFLSQLLIPFEYEITVSFFSRNSLINGNDKFASTIIVFLLSSNCNLNKIHKSVKTPLYLYDILNGI